MKIAMIAPLVEAVPPQCYGGTEQLSELLRRSWLREVTW